MEHVRVEQWQVLKVWMELQLHTLRVVMAGHDSTGSTVGSRVAFCSAGAVVASAEVVAASVTLVLAASVVASAVEASLVAAA